MKIILRLLLAFSSLTALAQPCQDFNTSPLSLGNWTCVSCSATLMGTLPPGNYLSINDGAGSSYFRNNVDFNKLYTLYPGQCLSYDYRVSNDAVDPPSSAFNPRIYVSKGSKYIYFEAYTPITEGTSWIHITVPILKVNTGYLTLPNNSNGQWKMPAGYTITDFNDIITNNDGIYFSIDVLGSSNTSEVIDVDNICIQKNCPSCNPNFKLSLDAGNGGFKVALTPEFKNPNSFYSIDWGDGTLPNSLNPFVTHTYATGGVYNICLIEYHNGIEACRKCMQICFDDPYSVSVPPASGGSGGEVAKTVAGRINDRNTSNPKQLMIYPNPTSGDAELEFPADAESAVSVKVFDLLGNVVLEIDTVSRESGQNKITLPTGNLNTGIYSVQAKVGGTSSSTRLIIQRK